MISRAAGTRRSPAPAGSLGRFHTATLGLLYSGTNFETGSLNTSFPSSSSIRIETAVTGLVIDASRNSVSFDIAFFASTSAMPCASKCTTLPLRATSVTAPEKSWPSMWLWIIGWMRFKRSEDIPTSSPFDTAGAAPIPEATSTATAGREKIERVFLKKVTFLFFF